MQRIENGRDFTRVLASLPVEQQHDLAKRFISSVIHLSNSPRLAPLQDLLSRPSCSIDDIRAAHDIARSVYVESAPGSDLSEVRFECQATHFIAQAVMACSSPTAKVSGPLHLAQKVANYCRMAQACSTMAHGDEGPDFAKAEAEYNKAVQQQFQIANDYLAAKAS
ncbi:MAG: hypothetical protein WAK92_07050 [Thiobacillus sp.]|jgi:hypothetical protein